MKKSENHYKMLQSKFITPVLRSRFANTKTPDVFQGSSKYKLDALLPEAEAADLLEHLNGIAEKHFAAWCKDNEATVKRVKAKKKIDASEWTIKIPVEPELDRETADETGYWIVKTSCGERHKPGVFDGLRQPFTEEIPMGSKIVIRADICQYVRPSEAIYGLTLRLTGVQVRELGGNGGSSSSADGFEEVAGGFDASGYKAPVTEEVTEDIDDGNDF